MYLTSYFINGFKNIRMAKKYFFRLGTNRFVQEDY
jgi:hypothetical protein